MIWCVPANADSGKDLNRNSATDTVQERGEDSGARVKDLTDGLSTGSAISPIDLA
jgi:hypothetical protein